jgi:hypothetical protein
MNYTVAGVSGGIGVSLYPFKDKVIFNVEARTIFRSPTDIQWKVNFDKIPLLKELPDNKGVPDVIISSPDCGSGSILRMSRSKEYGDHKQNDSLTLFFAAIKKYQPILFPI